MQTVWSTFKCPATKQMRCPVNADIRFSFGATDLKVTNGYVGNANLYVIFDITNHIKKAQRFCCALKIRVLRCVPAISSAFCLLMKSKTQVGLKK